MIILHMIHISISPKVRTLSSPDEALAQSMTTILILFNQHLHTKKVKLMSKGKYEFL